MCSTEIKNMATLKKTWTTDIGVNLVVDFASKNEKDWYVINDENYRPDKDKFVVEKFTEAFPDVKLPDINKEDRVYALCSRSRGLATWLKNINLEYSLKESTPTFYRDIIEPKRFKSISESATKARKLNQDKAREEIKLIEKYNNDINDINSRYSEKMKDISNDPFFKILNIDSSYLPVSLQNAIEDYTPASLAVDKKTYAREMLIRYKIALINFVKNCEKEKKDFNIDELLDNLILK